MSALNDSLFGDDAVHRDVVAFVREIDLRLLVRDAYGVRMWHLRQTAVIKAATIAEPVALGIKTDAGD